MATARKKTASKKTFQEKSYRLLDSKSSLTFQLKVGRDKKLLYFDENKGYNRAIRHCPNESSIFIDEQSEHAFVEPIIFITGLLVVSANDQTTQKFLDHHPSNSANGGSWFEEINEDIEAGEDIELEEMIIDIKQSIKEVSKQKDGVFQLEMVASVLKNYALEINKYTSNELKRMIYQYVDSQPYKFVNDAGEVNIFDDEYVKRKYLVLRSIADNIIKKSPNRKAMLWVNGNEVICSAPTGVDLVEFFTDYLSTDDGILVLEEMQSRA